MDSFKRYHGNLLEAIHRLPDQFHALSEAADKLASAGQVVCVGVGKSSYVAQKLNASLASISVGSSYLHPTEALHGDIGSVHDGAVVVIISKSGNSPEINALLPHLTRRACSIIAVCNREQSALGCAADVFLNIGISEEGESLNILPLMSVELSLVLTDLLVARISEIRGLTVETFAHNHPGGQLGRNVGLSLAELKEWKKRKPFVGANMAIVDAIAIDSKHRAGLVCVVDSNSKLLGVVSDGDIRRSLRSDFDLKSTPVSELMNSSPVKLNVKMLLGEALQIMEANGGRVFSAPVLDQEKSCCGVVTLHDLIK